MIGSNNRAEKMAAEKTERKKIYDNALSSSIIKSCYNYKYCWFTMDYYLHKIKLFTLFIDE
jgi:hypothetical protein